MDPPAFGHGPEGQVWKIEEQLPELLGLCAELLSEKPLFVLINGYAEGYSPVAFGYLLDPHIKKLNGVLTCGDLVIEEQSSGRLLPAGIFARASF